MRGKSGYFDISGTQNVRARVNWYEEYEIENNRSYIVISLQFLAQSPYGYYGYTYYPNGSIVVNGNTIKTFSSASGQDSFRIEAQDQWYPKNGLGPYESQWIAHADDGSKSITVSIDITGYVTGGGGGSGWRCSGSSAISLYTIPRSSSVRATDAFVESSTTIAVYRQANYTHSIKYTFGSLTGYITESGGLSSYESRFSRENLNVLIPTSFYYQMPNDQYKRCDLVCYTYYGGQLIGTSSSYFWVYCRPAICTPSVSGTVEDTRWPNITGNRNILIRYDSTARCIINAVAKNGAAIVRKTINGTVISGNELSIPEVPAGSFEFSATDSRGFTATFRAEKTLIPYITLTNNASYVRLGADTNSIRLLVEGNFYNSTLGASTNTLTAKYKVDQGQYVTVYPTIDGNHYKVDVTVPNMSYDSFYKLEVVVSDLLNTRTRQLDIKKSIPIADWGETDFRFNVQVQEPYVYFGATAEADPTAYADYLLQTGFSGTVMIQIGQGALTPEQYIMGQIICNGNKRCAIVLYGQHTIYTNVRQDYTWFGWTRYTGVSTVALAEQQDDIPEFLI